MLRTKGVLFLVFVILACANPWFGSAQDSLVVEKPSNVTIIKIDSSSFELFEKLLERRDSTQTALEKNRNKVTTPKELLEYFISPWKIVSAVIFVILAYIFIVFLARLLYFIADRAITYQSNIKGAVPLIRIFFWTIVIYILIAGIFKPPGETLIALGASIGVAVGFASQDVLKNIFGGIVILIDRPFIVGDKVEVGNYYGTVRDIGLRSTRIVTPDDSMVTVPNSEMMNSSVSNANEGNSFCQVVAEIYLPITVDTEEVRKIAMEAAQVSSYIWLNKPIVVLFFNEISYDRSFYKMRLKAYVMGLKHEFEFKSEMTEIVIRELMKRGILASDKMV